MFVPVYETQSPGFFTFGEKVTASAHTCLDNEAIKSFWNGFCCRSSALEITPADALLFSLGSAAVPALDGNQYAVNIESTGICITAGSEKGLVNGFMTLLHQIRVREIGENASVFEVKCGVFREKPVISNQIVHFCIFPETELWELERFIRFCAALKFSHLVLEFWGTLQYDCLRELGWKTAFGKEQIRPLIKLANDLGLEIIPMFNHWGHASASRAKHGKHVVLDQNPRLQPLFSDDGWSWNISNPAVPALLSRVRSELCELCGSGEYFHLGCDEAYNFDITPENYTVLTDYLNAAASQLAAEGRRAIVWGDMLVADRSTFNPNNRYTASCESEQLEQLILSALDRRIIIADWQYSVKEAPVETALIFKEAGFDTIVCPWDCTCGKSVIPCAVTAAENNLFGMMHTTWNTLSAGMRDVAAAAYASWNDCSGENCPPYYYYVTNAAKILRRVFNSGGDYEKCGWSKKQVGDDIK